MKPYSLSGYYMWHSANEETTITICPKKFGFAMVQHIELISSMYAVIGDNSVHTLQHSCMLRKQPILLVSSKSIVTINTFY